MIAKAVETGQRNPPAAARELFRALFPRVDEAWQATLFVVANRATAVRMGTFVGFGAAPTALGDNWFQCPHCADVFEGTRRKCPACDKPLAVAAPALEIVLGEGERIWVRAGTQLEWLRVEFGDRWFEILDDVGKHAIDVVTPPNVEPAAMHHDGTVLLVHPTKHEFYVAKHGILGASQRMTSYGELLLREIAAVIYPDNKLPTAADAASAAQRGHVRNEQLENAITADPDNADNYLVYADWLQAQGDPRGELIVLQHTGKPWVDYVRTYADHFWGPLAEYQHMLERFPYDPLGRATSWRWGFLEVLWIGRKEGRKDPKSADVEDALGWILDHPSARFLRELTVGIVNYEDNSYEAIAAVLGKRSLPTLRSLVLGDFFSEETELNWSHMGDLSPMYPAMPNLQSLTLRSGSMTIGAIDLPELVDLTIITGGFDPESLAQICKAAWPNLTSLSIQLGDESRFTLDHLAPIFAGTAFPKVTHLGLGNSGITDDICRGLASAPIAAQLESLDLSKGTMGDAGAAALLAGAFPNLKELDVDENYLGDDALAQLETLAGSVFSAEQRDDGGDPDDRYIAARE